MKKFLLNSSVSAALLVAVSVQASQTYVPVPVAKSTGVSFDIGYSAGVHHGKVSDFAGEVIVTSGLLPISAHLSVQIANMSTGNPTRDCHMREALGLEYTHSAFPKSHVCDSQNKFNDTVSYPKIEFELSEFQPAPEQTPISHLDVGKVYAYLVKGQWSLHGHTESFTFPVQVKVDGSNQIHIQGLLNMSLKKFGVVVMPFLVGRLFKITISDTAKIKLDVLFAPQDH